MRGIKFNWMKALRILFVIILITSKIQAKPAGNGKPDFKGSVKYYSGQKSSFDTLLVLYDRPYTPWGSTSLGFTVVTNEKGDFGFNLPEYSEPIKMEILVRMQGKWKSLESCFIQSGDVFRIDILKKGTDVSALYYGDGADRCNLAELLKKLEDKWLKRMDSLNLNDPDHLTSKLFQFNKLTDQIEKKRLTIIERSKLTKPMKRMITYEYGAVFSNWNLRLYDCFNRVYRSNAELRSSLKEFYNRYKSKFTYRTDSVMKNCPLFLGRLAGDEMRNLLLIGESDSVDLNSYYNCIKFKYTGLIRERLISDLFLGNTGLNSETKWTTSLWDSLMKDGQKYITLGFVRKRFSDLQRLNKGEKLFDSVFLDENGREISTKSLKGKVLFIDMWGTGCSACARFYQKFHKEFYPLLKDNKDFVYLSLSTDKTKEKWEAALNSGKYTSKEYLNVQFGSLGIDHPFAKYYDIQSAPFLLVVDRNGNIFSSVFKSDENVKDMILAALDQK